MRSVKGDEDNYDRWIDGLNETKTGSQRHSMRLVYLRIVHTIAGTRAPFMMILKYSTKWDSIMDADPERSKTLIWMT